MSLAESFDILDNIFDRVGGADSTGERTATGSPYREIVMRSPFNPFLSSPIATTIKCWTSVTMDHLLTFADRMLPNRNRLRESVPLVKHYFDFIILATDRDNCQRIFLLSFQRKERSLLSFY